jgi:SAM-dependent methyltransferase
MSVQETMRRDTKWQLLMFKKTLKKKLRLTYLKKHLGNLTENFRCLLVTCGDNNGAINYHLREIGGKWLWADLETKSIAEMSELLGEEVTHMTDDHLPFPEEQFDCVVSIDVHEHLIDPGPFTSELRRVAKTAGKIIITVPNGDEAKIATRIKNLVGMTKEKYGHVREGFDLPELKKHMIENGIKPYDESSFSKFFTEMLELTINLLYVQILSKKSKATVESGTIAPATHDQLKSVKRTYKMYSSIYPFFWLVSKLDFLFYGAQGYVVMVEGRKVQ